MRILARCFLCLLVLGYAAQIKADNENVVLEFGILTGVWQGEELSPELKTQKHLVINLAHRLPRKGSERIFTTQYELSDDVIIRQDGKDVSRENLKLGYNVRLRIIEDKVVLIDVYRPIPAER